MGRDPLDWYPLAAVCVCVCVCVCLCVCVKYGIFLRCFNAGFDHLLNNVFNENWFPLIVVESFLS